MKKQFLYLCLCFFTITTALRVSAQDPITMVIKEGIRKVIVAVDLKIQRLQTKTIWLQHGQKVVENQMSKLKLSEITDWVQKQKELYQKYFDELWQVKSVLSYYYRLKELTQQQTGLVKEYKRAWNSVRQDTHFTTNELFYMGKVYTGIIEESVKNLDQLSLVIQSFALQMSDAARFKLINQAADAMQQNYKDLNAFTTQNIQLSLLRSKDAQDIAVVKTLYGIQ